MDPVLFPLTFMFLTLPTIGIIGNAIMVIATYKAKRMNSPCHILIACTCFSDLLHETGQYPFVYHYFRNTTMLQYVCFYMQLVPLIGVGFGSPLILNLGIDRLIAIRLPSRYRFFQTVPYYYVSCHMLLPLTNTIYVLVMAFLTKNNSLVQCSVPQAYGQVAFQLMNNIGFGTNAVIVLVYIFAFYLLRRSHASSKMKTVFKSIFVTVVIVVVGWFATFIVNSLSFVITDDAYLRMVINMYAGITVNIGTAANFFVYYTINTEYRDIIKLMFGSRFYTTKIQEISTMHGLADSRRKSTIITRT